MEKGRSYTSDVTSGGGVTSHAGDWKITSLTDKSVTLQMTAKPTTIWGEAGLASSAKVGDTVTVKRDNSGRHCLRDWEDGTFTVYASRNGIPHYFKPL